MAIPLLILWGLCKQQQLVLLCGTSVGATGQRPHARRLLGASCGGVTQVAVWPAVFHASDVGGQGRRGPASSSLYQPSVLRRAAVVGGSQVWMGPGAPK